MLLVSFGESKRPGGFLWIQMVLAICLSLLGTNGTEAADFTFYADASSAGTTDCTPQSSGVCSGTCSVPTCGTLATPCQFIQQAINISNCTIGSNTTLEADVMVAPGTYLERLFIYPNIHVIGPGPDLATVDAVGQARSAVTFASPGNFGFGRPRVKFSVSGLTITHGTGTRIQLTFPGGDSVFDLAGGGVLVFGDASVTNCWIQDNVMENLSGQTVEDWSGAGIYIAVGNPTIVGNEILRNFTNPPDIGGPTAAQGLGAGLFVLRSDETPIIQGNLVRNNIGIAENADGAGLYVAGAFGTIVSNNVVLANSALSTDPTFPDSGGMSLNVTSDGGPNVYNNLIVGNVGGSSGAGVGLASTTDTANATLTNNTLAGNVLTDHSPGSASGAGIYAFAYLVGATVVDLTNNVTAQNDATLAGAGGGVYSYRAVPSHQNNDYFGNVPNDLRSDDPTFDETDVVGLNGNISANPIFVNAPVFWDHADADGTANTVVVFDSSRYAVNDWIEYNDDGVARQVTGINSGAETLTFTPALSAGITENRRIISNWGASSDVTEDFRLTAASPAIDTGTDVGAPVIDLDNFPRPVDGDMDLTATTDIGVYEFQLVDGDGDGVPDATDCAPSVNSVWMAPEQVPGPLMISEAQVLSWLPIPQSNVYNIYQGVVTSPFDYFVNCLITEVTEPFASIDIPPEPALDQAYFYLVGGANQCDDGPIRDNPLIIPSPACVAQNQDGDTDGIVDIDDNCPNDSNPSQDDLDQDTKGDACDNCAALYNPSQLDTNTNGIGDECEDSDSDTYPFVDDCDDTNPNVNPGQTEVCNGIDDNCVGGVDEGFDVDGDTYTTCAGDCDDGNPNVNPGMTEVCNGVDDNCVAGIDEGFDLDGDTYTTCAGDCDDDNFDVHPGVIEICNGIDDNCVSGIDEGFDGDSDSVTTCAGDCNDGNPNVWMPATEVTNLLVTQPASTQIDWDTQAIIAGPETSYDLVSGDLSPLPGIDLATHTCLVTATASTHTDSRPEPSLDAGYWYLTRASNSCATGTYGTAERDAAILLCP